MRCHPNRRGWAMCMKYSRLPCGPIDINFLQAGERADRVACSADGSRTLPAFRVPPTSDASVPSTPQVQVFSLRSRTKLQELSGATRWNSCDKIAFSPDGRYIVALSDNWLAAWDENGELVKEDDTEGSWGSFSLPSDVAITPDSSKVIWTHNTGGDTTASSTYSVRLHDLTTGRDVWWNLPGTTDVTALDISADGRRVVAGGRVRSYKPDAICEWSLDAPGGNIIDHQSFVTLAELQGSLSFAQITPDQSKLVAVVKEMVPASTDDEEPGVIGPS